MHLQINDRFKDAPWFIKSKEENILVGGVGGIGSSSMYCLAKTIPATYYIIDNDFVAQHNIGTQFFKKTDIDRYKVESISEMVKLYSDANTIPFNRKINEFDKLPITISAFDNMEARKQLFQNWKSLENREIFIDGRLRASMYEVYAVIKGREEEYETTLFNDSEVEDDMCTFKQTSYFAMMIGAKITQVLVNYLTNKYSEQDICQLPFKITEVGDMFYFNAE